MLRVGTRKDEGQCKSTGVLGKYYKEHENEIKERIKNKEENEKDPWKKFYYR